MIRTESRITVTGSARDAWDYLCDVGRWPEWAPTVLECWMRGGGPLRPDGWVEQRARDLGWNHHRSERVTVVEAPHRLAFEGTMGSSVARWGMEFAPLEDGKATAMMWVEVDLANVMRAIPPGVLRRRIQRVSDSEMAAIGLALEREAQPGAAR